MPTLRPLYTGTMAEVAGVRPGFGTDPAAEKPERASTASTRSEGGW
jgi:hypothetical protein